MHNTKYCPQYWQCCVVKKRLFKLLYLFSEVEEKDANSGAPGEGRGVSGQGALSAVWGNCSCWLDVRPRPTLRNVKGESL